MERQSELRVEGGTLRSPEAVDEIGEMESVLEAVSCAPERWAQLAGELRECLKQIEL